jgi:outer membrane protein
MILKRLTRGLALFTALLTVTTLQSQTSSYTLQQAQDYAVMNSYAVHNAQYDVQMANKKVKENLSYGFPQINGSLDYSYFINLPTSLIPGEFFGQPGEYVEVQFGTKNNMTAGVSLNQLIFDGRYFVGLQYAQIFRQLSEENLQKSEQNVKENVTNTYYMILVGEAALGVLDSTLKVLQKTRFETEQMYKEGFAEKTDYDQLTLTVANIENSINSVKRQNEIGYQLLKFQMGIPIDKPIELAETLDELIDKAAVEALYDQPFILEQHIDYKMVASQEQMKVLSLQNERAAYYPAMSGFLSVEENAQRNTFNFFAAGEPWFLTSVTGVSLKVPIWSSGFRKSRVDAARIDVEKMQNIKEQVSEALRLDVEQSRLQFKTALENYYREKENVDLSLEIYRQSLVKFEQGLISSMELTQQHNQFFSSERQYFETVLSLLNAKNKLDKALGNY